MQLFLFLHHNRLLIKILWRFVRISIIFQHYFCKFDKISILKMLISAFLTK
jgi:hypothetical protein